MPGGAACCELLPPAGRQELRQAPAALCRSLWAAHNAGGHLPKGGHAPRGPEPGDCTVGSGKGAHTPLSPKQPASRHGSTWASLQKPGSAPSASPAAPRRGPGPAAAAESRGPCSPTAHGAPAPETPGTGNRAGCYLHPAKRVELGQSRGWHLWHRRLHPGLTFVFVLEATCLGGMGTNGSGEPAVRAPVGCCPSWYMLAWWDGAQCSCRYPGPQQVPWHTAVSIPLGAGVHSPRAQPYSHITVSTPLPSKKPSAVPLSIPEPRPGPGGTSHPPRSRWGQQQAHQPTGSPTPSPSSNSRKPQLSLQAA